MSQNPHKSSHKNAHHQNDNKQRLAQENEQMEAEARFFKFFIIGAIGFVASLSAIVYANIVMPPSTQQELLALAGLVLAAPTGLCAAFFYLRMLFARLQRFKRR